MSPLLSAAVAGVIAGSLTAGAGIVLELRRRHRDR